MPFLAARATTFRHERWAFDLTFEKSIEEQVGQLRILIERFLNLSEETAFG